MLNALDVRSGPVPSATAGLQKASPKNIYEGRRKHPICRMLLLGVSFLIAAVACGIWYWFAMRYSRRRAAEISRWIESALGGEGHVTGIRWVTASRLQLPLRLAHGIFRRASMLVDMSPCEFPLHWLLGKINGKKEILTFQADLDLPPVFSLHVQNFRWFARSSRKTPRRESGWCFERTAPLVLTTRSDWQKEVSLAVGSLAQGRSHDFLSITFQRRSPHFSVTLPLQAIAPESPTRTCIFESMRELASNSSASLF